MACHVLWGYSCLLSLLLGCQKGTKYFLWEKKKNLTQLFVFTYLLPEIHQNSFIIFFGCFCGFILPRVVVAVRFDVKLFIFVFKEKMKSKRIYFLAFKCLEALPCCPQSEKLSEKLQEPGGFSSVWLCVLYQQLEVTWAFCFKSIENIIIIIRCADCHFLLISSPPVK